MQGGARVAAARQHGAARARAQARQAEQGVVARALPGTRQPRIDGADAAGERLKRRANLRRDALECGHVAVAQEPGGGRAGVHVAGQRLLHGDRVAVERLGLVVAHEGQAAPGQHRRLSHPEQRVQRLQHGVIGELAGADDVREVGKQRVGEDRAQRRVGGQGGRIHASLAQHGAGIGDAHARAVRADSERCPRGGRIERRPVAGGAQLARDAVQRLRNRGSRPERALEQLPTRRPQELRLDDHQTGAGEQPHPAPRDPAGIGCLPVWRVRRARAAPVACGKQMVKVSCHAARHLGIERQPAQLAAAGGAEGDAADLAVRLGPEGVVGLADVVVLRRQPEHRHAPPSGALGRLLRQPHRGGDLVDGVYRTAEQPRLLAGDDAGRPSCRQRLGVRDRAFVPVAPALVSGQRLRHRGR